MIREPRRDAPGDDPLADHPLADAPEVDDAPSPSERELDLDLEEVGDSDRLKEGFTGQER